MVISNGYLMIFALAMMGCVLATPLVTQIASWVGAIDRPDQFRRIHTGAIPRLGGLGLALGIAAGTVLPHLSGSSRFVGCRCRICIMSGRSWRRADHPGSGIRRRHTIDRAACQAAGAGPGRADPLPGGHPDPDHRCARPELRSGTAQHLFDLLGMTVDLALPSLLVTMFWFLGCMNVWNLIDGHGRTGVGRRAAGERNLDPGGDSQ